MLINIMVLKSFYKKEFKFGKSKELKINRQSAATTENTTEFARTATFEDVVLMEVFVNNEERARGYVVNDKDTNEFLYFIDVDRINYKLTSVDIDANETKVADNINQLENYVSSNQFDMIKVVEDYNDSTVTAKVWGTIREWGACGPNSDGSAGCFEGELSTYVVFGIRTRPWRSTGLTRACECP